jgi:lipopolysaccharide biosynthesis glycosyltransferase
MPKIFIGWDSRFPESADVLRHSLLEHASIPLDIRYLKLHELGLSRAPDPRASTEFTYSRFLVPHLCGFTGKAIFMDSDMLCFADIKELDDLDMDGLALRVVKQDHRPVNTVKMYGCEQSAYPRKNWSSLMVMNCERLTLWSKSVVGTQSGAFLHRFEGIPDEQIGEIPMAWNSLDRMDESTKMIHYTDGGPWLEAYRDHPHADVWYKARDAMHESTRRGRAI